MGLQERIKAKARGAAEGIANKVVQNDHVKNITFEAGAILQSEEMKRFGKICKGVKDNHIRPVVKTLIQSPQQKDSPQPFVPEDPDFMPISHMTIHSNKTSKIQWSDGRIEKFETQPRMRVFKKDCTIVVEGEDCPRSEVNLPILIFPGIASSGLYVKKSGEDKKYEGKRLWMNAGFLASSATVDRSKILGACNQKIGGKDSTSRKLDKFPKQEEKLAIRSAWLYHISLDTNMIDDRPNNEVGIYEGLDACAWLVDETDYIGKTQAGVWADVIHFLETEMGYEKKKNLDAAPYDWRLPPSATETRKSYLSNTIKQVERMYKENGDLPVVLCCHSMGCKMGHYFLNFCLREKGQEWIDRHIHSYMPIGAPHGGANLTVKLGATGAGLVGFIDNVMLSKDEGLIMYRSWGSGPWLIPRELPPGVIPSCIVRKEGELGIMICSQLDVTSLFIHRGKRPKELRLTIEFRKKIYAKTEYVELKIEEENGLTAMVLDFRETAFYLAVPNMEDDDLGKLVFYLEEPNGRMNTNYDTKLRTYAREATDWARDAKKQAAKAYRRAAKPFGGSPKRVAVNPIPIQLKSSDFERSSRSRTNGKPVLETEVSFCGCDGTAGAMRMHSNPSSYHQSPHSGALKLQFTYQRPPDISKRQKCIPPLAALSTHSPSPPIVSSSNAKNEGKIVYESWSAKDLFKHDGFFDKMFDLHKTHYDGDPLGPTTKSALDAPPVKCVRSIYGINLNTEVSAVYRKEPVVVIGDKRADSRFKIDSSAKFPEIDNNCDAWTRKHLSGYDIAKGLISETPRTLQNIPGKAKQRRCCGDGTVPYWSMVHCLEWKEDVQHLTLDELEGAEHRSILSDTRFHALLKQYCRVSDPRYKLIERNRPQQRVIHQSLRNMETM